MDWHTLWEEAKLTLQSISCHLGGTDKSVRFQYTPEQKVCIVKQSQSLVWPGWSLSQSLF
jgi:hypothetical protein